MKIEAKLSFKGYLKLVAYLTVKKPLMIILMAFIALFLIDTACYFLGFREHLPYFGLSFSLFCIVVYPLLIYFNTKKNFYSNKRLQEKIGYEFSNEKIIVSGETFTTEMDWSKIYRVVELKSWVLIYQSIQTANIIPKESFNGCLDEFREIVKSSGVKSKLKKK